MNFGVYQMDGGVDKDFHCIRNICTGSPLFLFTEDCFAAHKRWTLSGLFHTHRRDTGYVAQTGWLKKSPKATLLIAEWMQSINTVDYT